MRFIPSSIFYYLVSHVDPKKPYTTGKKYKPGIAITCKDVVKSWAKRLMKNPNRLQIEIYGVKRMIRYSGIPLLQVFRRNSDSEVCAL